MFDGSWQLLTIDLKGIVKRAESASGRQGGMFFEEERSSVQREPRRAFYRSGPKPGPIIVQVAGRSQPYDIAVEIVGTTDVGHDEHNLGESGSKHVGLSREKSQEGNLRRDVDTEREERGPDATADVERRRRVREKAFDVEPSHLSLDRFEAAKKAALAAVGMAAQHERAALRKIGDGVGLMPKTDRRTLDALHGLLRIVHPFDDGVNANPVDPFVPPVFVAEEPDVQLVENGSEQGRNAELVIVIAWHGGNGSVHEKERLQRVANPFGTVWLPDVDVVANEGDEVRRGIEGHGNCSFGASNGPFAAKVKVSQDGHPVAPKPLRPTRKPKGPRLEPQVFNSMQHAPRDDRQPRRPRSGNSERPSLQADTIGKRILRGLSVEH